MIMSTEENLQLFAQLISCTQEIRFFTFDSKMNFIRTADSENPILKLVFSLSGKQKTELDSLLDLEKPVVMTGEQGYLWIAEAEKNSFGELTFIHVIGPVFTEEIAAFQLEKSLSHSELPASLKRSYLQFLQDIPFVPLTRFFEFGLMLHFCIYGEKITFSDLLYQEINKPKTASKGRSATDSHGSWAIEQKMLRLISDGNPDFHKLFGKAASAVNLGDFNIGDPVRYLKDMIIVSITLCSRAAISGGLDPEMAYTLSDKYIKSVEQETTIAGISDVNMAMQNDFVERVHRLKMSSGMSQHIQKCCDYILTHVEEKITEAELAKLCGYSQTHLSRKFRQETGFTVKEYIMNEKIEQAKNLLISENLSVQEITDQLGFESQSYLGKKFKESTGMTPMQFRNSRM